jgi:MoaA/NifB/PqqE/SkfB family radical SAM enzyme
MEEIMEERIEEIAQGIFKWSYKEKISPYEVRLSPTNNCNLACLPCVSRGRPLFQPEEELTKEEYLHLIKDAASLGAKRFDICGGGEPFMRTEFILAIMEKIKKLGMKGSISTNGTLLNKEIIEKIVRIRWDEIRFSVNGPNQKIDDYLRGVKGAFKKSTEAIKTFAYFKGKLNQKNPQIILMPILTSLNYNKLCEFVELAHSLEVDALIFQPFMSETPPDPRGLSEKIRKKISRRLMLKGGQRKRLQSYLEKAKKLAEKYNLHNNFDFIGMNEVKKATDELIYSDSKKYDKNPMLKIPCFVPWWLIDINTNGEVGACSGIQIRESIREKSLKEIWLGKNFEEFRKALVIGRIPESCKICCAISVMDNRKIREALSQMLSGAHGKEK